MPSADTNDEEAAAAIAGAGQSIVASQGARAAGSPTVGPPDYVAPNHEELQTINEELRLASEELEISREELQSINEDLITVNQELKRRVEELGRANGDLHNLMAATNIATIFLDRALHIARYTPSAVALFNLIPTDVGRPLTDLQHRLSYPDLAADARQVLAHLTPATREVHKPGDGWFLARLQPYRTVEDQVAGLVLTFVDISEHKLADERLLESELRQAFLLRFSDALQSQDDPLKIQQVAMRMLGEQLRATRAFYFFTEPAAGGDWIHIIETDYRHDPDRPSHAGRHSVKNFGLGLFEGAEHGKVVAVEDVTKVALLTAAEIGNYLAVDVVAFINVPLIKHGKFVAGIGAHDSVPRPWLPDEITLIQEVAARTWASLERARAEQALCASEERLQAMAAHLPGGAAFILDGSLRYLLAEGEALRGAGLQPVDLVGKTIFEALLPELAATYEPLLRRALAGEPFTHEHSGHGRDFVSRGTPLRGADGETHSVLAVSYDITERKRAEETLRYSEEMFSALVGTAPFGVYLVDAAFCLRTVNAGSRAVFAGIEPLLGRDFAEILRILWPEPFASEAIGRFRHTLETGESFVSPPIVAPRANIDEIQSYDWQLHRVILPDGSPGVVCYFYDLSAQKRLEAALAAAEERLRLIVESAHEHAIISLDLERRVESWNPGATAIFGYTREEMLGRSADVIFTPADQAAGAPALEADTALANGRAGDNRWHQRKDGSHFWAEGVMLPMCAQPGGPIIGLVKILRDETPAREAREALERSQLRLLEALEETECARKEAEAARVRAVAAGAAKDHFLAVLSHELRTPLMPITMALAVLARRQDLPEAVTRTFAMIQRNVDLEAHFIDDLLDVTRIERGKMEISRENINLYEAIERAVEVTAPDIEGKGQRLVVSLEGAACPFHGDLARLQQVFWNLLKNASKFTPPGGTIEIRSRCEVGDHLVVEVADTGIGLAAEAIERIFQPFEQASASITREFGGLGLGLSIAKATVDAHGGTLRVRSAGAGQGATFTVTLPSATPSQGTAEPTV